MEDLKNVKEQGEKEQLKFLRDQNPDVFFDESESHEKGMSDFLARLKEKERNITAPKTPSLFYRIISGLSMLFVLTFFRSLYLNLTVSDYDKRNYHSPSYKLISGIIMMSLFWLLAYNDFSEYMEHKKYNIFIQLIINLTAVIWFVKGIYRICTFNYYNPTFESNSGLFVKGVSSTSSQTNIDRAISYRDTQLGAMNGMEAADLLIKTSVLDAAKNGSFSDNPNAQRAVSYLDSKLGGMSGMDGVDYLSGKK